MADDPYPVANEREPDPEQGQGEDAPKDDAAILEEALKRFDLAKESDAHIRDAAIDDLEFLLGHQWDERTRADRLSDGRPCLVVNRLPQFVQQVTNEQRQNRPTIKIHPLDNPASEETAEIIQGLIRHIGYVSNADAARDTAFESAVRASFGYYRVTTGYVSPDSFEQEIYVKRIRNQLSVMLDPFAQEPDGSDAEWGFIIDDLSRDDFKRQFSKSKLTDPSEWEIFGNQRPEWVNKDGARVVEYFYKEYRDGKIYQLSTGETVKDEDLHEHAAAAAQSGLPVSIVSERATKFPVVKWCKLSAAEILESTTWPGQYIPIIPVYGNEYFVNGKRHLEGIVRNAKDAQRMLNFWKSAEAEAIALAPRAPFIGYEGQFEGHEAEWKTANRKNHAYLEARATTIDGQPAPLPQRSSVEPAVQAITQAAMQAADDIKATTGVYDAAMGAQSNEIAGVAIKARSAQVQTSNYHFTDNLTRAIKYEGKILVDLIPHIYDTARAARIIGDDGTHKIVQLNQEHEGEDGKPVLYDVTAGRYDVTVDTGPSYASRREEAAATMLQLMQAMPNQAVAIADIAVRNMDAPGAQELSERLQKMLPPQLQDGPQKDIPPQVKAMLSQQGQMLDALKKELDEATKVIETKTLELQHKERVEMMRIKSDAEIQLAKLGSQEAIAMLDHNIREIEQRQKLLNMNVPIQAPDNFDPQNADGGSYAGIGHIGGTTNLTGEDSPGSPMDKETP